MQWIKTHLAVVICGAIGLVSIALIVLGALDSKVADAMAKDSPLYSSLQTMERSAANQRVIEEARKVQTANRQRLERALSDLAELGTHKPLRPNVFPKAANWGAPFQFQDAYIAKQKELLEKLGAKDAPSEDEIQEERDKMERLKKQLELESKEALPSSVESPSRVSPRSRQGWDAVRDTQTTKDLAAMTPEELVEEDADARVSVRRARAIYCYGSVRSLDPRPEITQKATGTPPSVEDMWAAQVSIWVQEDVITALAELNNRIASQMSGKKPWVGNLPVKHLVEFRVSNYMPFVQGGSGGRGSSSAAEGASLTGRPKDKNVDVVHFSLELVIAAQYLPAVIDEICKCKAGFYTPLMVKYEEGPPNTRLVEYVYGSEPTIKVFLDFEGCFLPGSYEQWMPETVKEALKEGSVGGWSGRSSGSSSGRGSGRW